MNRRQLIGSAMTALAFPLAACAGDDVCTTRAFEGSTFTVCPYDTRTASLTLVQSDGTGTALRSFDRLATWMGPRAQSVRFAMNAGMFDAFGAPIGLYVEKGVIRHPLNTGDGDGNFYLKPNGVFFIAANGLPVIATTAAFAAGLPMPPWATQSGPLLVTDGAINPQISPDGASKYIRNAVGVLSDGTAVFVISEAPVSFGRLARFMRDGLGCANALYLDGAVSGLWVPSRNRRDDRAQLGPMILVTNRAE